MILTKVRYQTNDDMLEEVDDTLDGSELKEIVHTEWDLFLGKLTQLLSKVGVVMMIRNKGSIVFNCFRKLSLSLTAVIVKDITITTNYYYYYY